jgi:hypothetical protein
MANTFGLSAARLTVETKPQIAAAISFFINHPLLVKAIPFTHNELSSV